MTHDDLAWFQWEPPVKLAVPLTWQWAHSVCRNKPISRTRTNGVLRRRVPGPGARLFCGQDLGLGSIDTTASVSVPGFSRVLEYASTVWIDRVDHDLFDTRVVSTMVLAGTFI